VIAIAIWSAGIMIEEKVKKQNDNICATRGCVPS